MNKPLQPSLVELVPYSKPIDVAAAERRIVFDVGLTAVQKLVWWARSTFLDARTRRTDVTQAQLAAGLGVDERTIRIADAELVRRGFIRVERRGRKGVGGNVVQLEAFPLLARGAPAEKGDRAAAAATARENARRIVRSGCDDVSRISGSGSPASNAPNRIGGSGCDDVSRIPGSSTCEEEITQRSSSSIRAIASEDEDPRISLRSRQALRASELAAALESAWPGSSAEQREIALLEGMNRKRDAGGVFVDVDMPEKVLLQQAVRHLGFCHRRDVDAKAREAKKRMKATPAAPSSADREREEQESAQYSAWLRKHQIYHLTGPELLAAIKRAKAKDAEERQALRGAA